MASSENVAEHQSGNGASLGNGGNGEDTVSHQDVANEETLECVEVEKEIEGTGFLGVLSDMVNGKQKETVKVCKEKKKQYDWESSLPIIRSYVDILDVECNNTESELNVKYGGEYICMVLVPFKDCPENFFKSNKRGCRVRTWDWLFQAYKMKSPFTVEIGFRTPRILTVHVYDIVKDKLVPKESFSLNEMKSRFK